MMRWDFRGFVTLLAALACSVAANAQLGYDTSFATNGKYVSGLSGDDIAKAMTLYHGKVYVAGVCPSTARPPAPAQKPACVLRLLGNGQPDSSFNAGNASNTSGRVAHTLGDVDTDVSDIKLTPDGKITVSGRCLVASVQKACVLRLLSDGALDAGFGSGGRAYLDHETTVAAESLPLLAEADGNVLIGSAAETTAPSFVARDTLIRRLSATGVSSQFARTQLGTTSGANGYALVPRVLLRQPDGKVLVAIDAQATVPPPTISVMAALRFLSNGSPDQQYGGGTVFGPSVALAPVPPSGTPIFASVNRASLSPDNTLVLVGQCGSASFVPCAAGLYPVATQGAVFGDWMRFGFVEPEPGLQSATTGRVGAVATTVDNKAVLVYSGGASDPGATVIRRILLDGTIDPTFPTIQNALLDSKRRLVEAGMMFQPDRKLVIAGNDGASNDFAVARLGRVADPGPACLPDIDGDGANLATVDGLLWTRVMLGLTGAGVTGGIVFPPGSSRTSWAAIRSYLVNECAMTLAP